MISQISPVAVEASVVLEASVVRDPLVVPEVLVAVTSVEEVAEEAVGRGSFDGRDRVVSEATATGGASVEGEQPSATAAVVRARIRSRARCRPRLGSVDTGQV